MLGLSVFLLISLFFWIGVFLLVPSLLVLLCCSPLSMDFCSFYEDIERLDDDRIGVGVVGIR